LSCSIEGNVPGSTRSIKPLASPPRNNRRSNSPSQLGNPASIDAPAPASNVTLRSPPAASIGSAIGWTANASKLMPA
jgi:hypothetical protein